MRMLALVAVLISPSLALAQYGYGYGYPSLRGPGATLYGAAQVVQSQGNVLIQQEQARSAREKAAQEKIKTKRLAFDEMMYEKANTPSVAEEEAKKNANTLFRIMNQSSPAEIARGATLNFMLPYLKKYADRGVAGPPQMLNTDTLASLNVQAGSVAGPGLLKDPKNLRWPLAVRGPTQKKLAAQLPDALTKAATGDLDLTEFNQVLGAVRALQNELSQKYRKDEIDGSAFLAGKHFLDALEPSVQALQDPNAVKYLNGTYSARGNTVPELVENMAAQGLTFGPAAPGQEAAYTAMHNAFVAYARAAQSAQGFAASANLPFPRPAE